MKSLKLLMIGPGAIGGTTAAFIAKAGYDITIVCNREETTKQINDTGIKIAGVLGCHEIKMKAVTKIPELKGTFDIVFIATKAYDMAKVAYKLIPYLHEKSLVVSMQNGICIDQLSSIVGENRTIGCLIGFNATMIERGHLSITKPGNFIIGSMVKENEPLLTTLQKILNSFFPTTITNNILGEMYSKLILNSGINSLGAITGLKFGEITKIKVARSIFIEIINEAMKVAETLNLHVPSFIGMIDYNKFIQPTILKIFKQHLIIKNIGKEFKFLKSSSLQAIENSQQTEIDHFNGYIVRKAKELNINVPINTKLVEMVKQIENKQLSSNVNNLYNIM